MEQADQPPDRLDGLRANVDGADVYLNDSFEAADALSKARGFARRGLWVEAAEVLHQASESSGDKLVRISPGAYTGVRRYISNRIASWPPAGIDAYRALVRDDLETALLRLGDSRRVDDLLALFGRYFCTATAAGLADTIAQLAIESGDLDLARHVYERVLTQHPDAKRYESRYGVMLRLIAAMQGMPPPVDSAEDDDGKVRWMGQEHLVRDVISDIRERFTSTPFQERPGEWPIFGGNATRNRQSATDVEEPGLLWRFHSTDPENPEGQQIDIISRRDRNAGRDLTASPVVSGGFVYIQRYREILALHRNTGVTAWHFRADDHRVERDDYLDDEPPGWDSATVYDGRVYAALPGEELMYYHYEPAQRNAELVCLDARTGKVIWRTGPGTLDTPRSEIRFDSTPIVRHGRLYVVGRRRRSFGFEDCYLYRFNAVDGSFEHRAHLGGASTATFGSRTATTAIAALHGDTVYVCTGLGSWAAVYAHTGEVRWLRIYERHRDEHSGALGRSARNVNPWQYNPIIWSEGRIICLPTDGESVLVAEAENGRLIRSIPIDQLGGMETVYGVRDGLLCGAGREAACFDLEAGSLRWSQPLPEDAGLFGRGVWTGDDLLVPTRRGLSRFRVLDGRRTDTPWDEGGEGGNLLALPNQLLVASGDRLSAYVPKAEIWKSLRDRMAAAPSDPLPALELAEVAFGAGEYSEALAVLGEAAGRADRLTTLDAALEQRLFTDILKFAQGLADRSKLDPADMDTLFNFAGRHSHDPKSNVTYRMRFASLFEQSAKPQRALRMYHQILRDRSLRELITDPEVPGVRTAGAAAESHIARLLQEHEREIYADYEARASRWLQSARAAGDEVLFESLVATFPNSRSAPLALTAHGDLLLAAGRAGTAARKFTEAYRRYNDQSDRPGLMRKIADALERAGRPEHAYRWLTKAARDYPATTVKHKGRQVTFLQYREHLAGVRHRVEPSRPNVTLPLSGSSSQQFDGPVALLTPRFGDNPASQWSNYYVSAPVGIRAFDSATGEQTWDKPAPVKADPALLIARSDGAVFATLYEIFALDRKTGHLLWTHGEYPKHLDDPGADWEEGGSIRTLTLQEDRLVIARDNGELTCVALDTGREVWQETRRPAPLGRAKLVDPWFVYHVVQDGRAVIVVIEAATGAWHGAILTDEERPTDEILLTIDGRVVLVTSQSISCYDVETMSILWRTSTGGSVRHGSLVLDLDTLYFAESGGELQKIRVEDGRVLWRSERLIERGDDDLVVLREGASLIATTTSSITAVDSTTGMTLWQGTTPDQPRLSARLLTKSYVLVVDVGAQAQGGAAVAYFYDHRNASGVIPRVGGALELGSIAPLRTVLAVDNALLIQTGSTIHSFVRQ